MDFEHLKNYENIKYCFDLIRDKTVAINCLTFEDYKCFTDYYKRYSNTNKIIVDDMIFNSKNNTYNHRTSLTIEFNRDVKTLEIHFSNRQDFIDLGFTVINFDSFLNLKNINDFCEKNKIKFVLDNFHKIESFYFDNINKNFTINNNLKKFKNNDFGIGI